MKLAMHEITTRDGTFPEHIAAYAKTGWKHFEINLWKAMEFIDKNGIPATRRLLDDQGVTCVGATGIGLTAFKDDAARAKDIEQIKRYGEILQGLGCRPIVTGAGGPEKLNRDNYSEMLDRLADHVLKVADAGVPFGVQLAIEVNWCSLCRSFRTAAELVRRTAHPSVGVTWDPAHFHSTPSRLGDLDLLQGKILHAHLDDMNGTFVEVVNINADRVIPGEGILPMREWTNKVTACGYQGYHCLELFSEALWKEDLETICRKGMRGCLQVWPDATF